MSSVNEEETDLEKVIDDESEVDYESDSDNENVPLPPSTDEGLKFDSNGELIDDDDEDDDEDDDDDENDGDDDDYMEELDEK